MPTKRANRKKHTGSRTHTGRRLRLESLEPRILLSGGSPTDPLSPGEDEQPEMAEGQILVGTKGTIRDLTDHLDKVYPGAEILHVYSGINAALIGLPEGDSVETGLQTMQEVRGVKYAEPDYMISLNDLPASGASSAGADSGSLGVETALDPSGATLTATFSCEGFEFVASSAGGELIVAEGFSLLGDAGNPRLPQATLDLALPPDADLSTVEFEVTGLSSSSVEGDHDIAPAPPAATTVNGEMVVDWGPGKVIEDGRNTLVYGEDDFFGDGPIRLLGTEQMRDWKFATFQYQPFQYNPVSGEILHFADVDFQVSFDTSAALDPALLADSGADQRAAEQLVNYEELAPLYTPQTSAGEAAPSQSGDVADYVVVTTSSIQTSSSSLSAFLAHKQSMGYSTSVVTESTWGGGTGDEAADNIRTWLSDNYADWGTDYVLLIGDPNPADGDVPMKMTYPRSGEAENEKSPTDYYYSDLTANWDSDGDSLYGEWSDDLTAAPAPEVLVGRIPFYGSAGELDGILQKIMAYETESDTDWRQSALIPTAISNYENEDDQGYERVDGHNLAEYEVNDITSPAGWSDYTLYEKEGLAPVTATSDAPLTGSNVRSEWQNGYGVVTWWGHGSETGAHRKIWANDDGDGIPEANEMQSPWPTFFESADAASLDDSHPSLVIQSSCNNGYPENSGNLGYSLLQNGAIATVSASRVSWYTVEAWDTDLASSVGDNASYDYHILRQMADGSGTSFGQALSWCKENFGTGWTSGASWMNMTDFNLYGDPSATLTPSQTGPGASLPNDPEFDRLWGLHNTGQTGGTPDADIDAPEAWEITTGSSRVTVGVIDTGIEYYHEDLADNMWVNPGEIAGNNLDDDGNGYVDDIYGWDFVNDDNSPLDDVGHGTHVAGTIGAVGDNATGVTGVNWDVSLAALKVFASNNVASASGFAEAIMYAADMGFDVTNNSWGGYMYTQVIRDAIEYAGDRGQLFIAAAGNDAVDNDLYTHYPSSYDLDNIIAVSSTGPDDELVLYSNYGATTVDLAAPGGVGWPYDENDIYSTVPGVDDYEYMAGTSMAAPHVTGAAALLKAYNGGATSGEIKTALMDGVDQLPNLDGLMVTGGRLNVANSLGLTPEPLHGQDLAPTSLNVESAALYNATVLQGSYVITNRGDSDIDQSFQISLYFSDDAALGGNDDHLLETTTVPDGLVAFGTYQHSFAIQDIPAGDPFGTDGDYYLLVAADTGNGPGGEVDEGQYEDNNMKELSVTWDRGAIFRDDFSTDKGWTDYAEDRWERGPAESGGGEYGFPDPPFDTTPTDDNYLLGYNIGGDYQNSMGRTLWITSPTVDLTDVQNVEVAFQRWLNVEDPWYDEAAIQVFDGTMWQTVWNNWMVGSFGNRVTDSSWSRQSYDVSQYADDNPDFRVRFGMGPTDFAWRFSGWNIDDFEIIGDLAEDTTPPEVSGVQVQAGRAAGAGATVRLQFNEGMARYPLSDSANYQIQGGAGIIPLSDDDVTTGQDYVEIRVSQVQPGQDYALTAFSGGLVDYGGNALDGDRDGEAGGDFHHNFTIPGLYAGEMDAYGGRLTFYDTDATSSDEIDVRPVARVTGDNYSGIGQVILQPQYSRFGVVIEQKPGSSRPFSIIDQTFQPFDITYIVADGNVSALSLQSNLTGLNLNGARIGGNVSLSADLDEDGESGDAAGFVTVGANRGNVNLLFSSGAVDGDMVVSGNLYRGVLAGNRSTFDGDLRVGGNLTSLRVNGNGFRGKLSVGGTLGLLEMNSPFWGDISATSITSARFAAGAGISGTLHADGGDISLVRSVEPISGSIEGDHIRRIVALNGIQAGASVTAHDGLGLLVNYGDMEGDVTVSGDVGALYVLGGDLAGSLTVTNGDVGKVAVRRGSLGRDGNGTLERVLDIEDKLVLLNVYQPMGTAIQEEVMVGGSLLNAYVTGDIGAPITVGSDGDGDRLGVMVVRGAMDADLTVGGDLTHLSVLGGQITDNQSSDERITVSGDADVIRVVGYAGGGAAIEDDISVGGKLSYFLVNGSGSSGTLTAGNMGRIIYYTSTGIVGDVNCGAEDDQTDGTLDLLRTLGPIDAAINVDSRAGTILTGQSLTSAGSITVGSGHAGNRLGNLVVRGDLLGAVTVDGNMSRARVGGDLRGTTVDVSGNLDRLTVLGDLIQSDVTVEGSLANTYVGRNFTDSGIEANGLGRVVIRNNVYGQWPAEPDVIHARTGRFDLFAAGRYYDIDGTEQTLSGVRVFAG